MRTTSLRRLVVRLPLLLAAGSLVLLAGAPGIRIAEVSATFPSANGRIAFHGNRDGDYDIFTMTATGNNVMRLTRNRDDDTWPAWSADGKRIAFAYAPADGSRQADIYTMTGKGKHKTQRNTHPSNDLEPAWSPDGTRIAFTSERDGNPEIYVMDAEDADNDGNGDNPTRLTNNPADDVGPDWQPRP